MNKLLLLCFFVVSSFTFFGCQGEKKAALVTLPSTDPDAPKNVDQEDGVPPGSPLYMKVGIAWESQSSSNAEFMGTCALDANSSVGAHKECRITIPEQRLYFSTVKFRVGTLSSAQCGFLSFQPYYFRRSAVKIQNQWEGGFSAPVYDCAATPTPAKCFGGAAPAMKGDGFSTNSGYYFLTAVGNQQDFDLISSNTTRQLGSAKVNWMVTNDPNNPAAGLETPMTMPTPTPTPNPTPTATPEPTPAPTPIPAQVNFLEKKTGIANWQDYELYCTDIWGEELYSMKVIISDENTEDTVNGGTYDTFKDWSFYY